METLSQPRVCPQYNLIDPKVLVVGAGVVGLTTAILLATQGYNYAYSFSKGTESKSSYANHATKPKFPS